MALVQDIRYALRSLRRVPAVTVLPLVVDGLASMIPAPRAARVGLLIVLRSE